MSKMLANCLAEGATASLICRARGASGLEVGGESEVLSCRPHGKCERQEIYGASFRRG